MGKRIIFIGCGYEKANKRTQAKNMYKGELFNKALEYAYKLNPSKIFILSAKYHVLELDDEIEPYNESLNKKSEKEKKYWAYYYYKSLLDKGIDFSEEAIFLCGANYYKYLSRLFKNPQIPTKNLIIGQQLHFYKEEAKCIISKKD